MSSSPFAAEEPMAELHAHLGGSVPTYVMWESAHAQGIALPTRDYWEFDRMVSISDPRGVDGLDALDEVYHVTELIQSSPLAVERCVHGMIGGGYRSQRITTCEVRFNPMKRNRGGERDLDHIILAALRGVDRAQLEYPQVRAGVILMMDRTFDDRQNEIIVEKAIRYAARGVVGIDIAGPRPGGGRFAYAPLAPLVQSAREAGLGVTVHCGEEGFAEEVGEVVEALRPDRIGHGILAAGDPELTALLASSGIVLEVCPTSNLLTGALADADAVRAVFRTFLEAGVRVTVSTDGPEMMRTHLRDEFAFLCSIGALSAEEARAANALAHEVSFVGPRLAARL
jgi:adenosine deaminase